MEVLPLIVIYVVIIFIINIPLSYIRKFKRMKLFNGGVSRTLSDIGIKQTYQFKKMLTKGIFIQVKENKYYLNEEKGVEYAKKKRSLIYTATFFFILMFFFVLNNF